MEEFGYDPRMMHRLLREFDMLLEPEQEPDDSSSKARKNPEKSE